MIRSIITLYSPLIVPTLVYMLQSTDYRFTNYVKWLLRTRHFDKVMYRRRLEYTTKSGLLVLVGAFLYVSVLAVIIYYAFERQWIVAAAAFVFLPYVIGLLLALLSALGYVLFQNTQEKKIFNAARISITSHPGVKIAVAGSYGKTTFKELLYTVLDEKFHVAASPGNMNTLIGLSRFIAKLDGTEDVVIFELGEEKPGDVKKMCKVVRPGIGVITGISEAHLETFKSIERIAATIFELQDHVGAKYTYKNTESKYVAKYTKDADLLAYSQSGVNGWRVKAAAVDLEKTEFIAQKGNASVCVKTKLLGRHQIGPICACIDIAHQLGMTAGEIESALEKVVPFEHRMQPRYLNGALIIDDTYNGNINGVESGLRLLKDAGARRKIYVTPGLVEQGDKTGPIHVRMGELMAPVADMVVLMKNSTTAYICRGLKNKNFTGELKIFDDPLEFYDNIGHFVVAGDVVLMQNDWTDNYA